MALTNNLLAFYKLDDLQDSSGNNRTLTNNGNVTFSSGKIGNAANFDGSNSLISDTQTGIETNEISLAAWVYPTQNKQHVILCQNFDDSSPWFLNPYEGQLQVTGGGGGTYTFGMENPSNNSYVPLNVWTHVCTTYNDSTKTWKAYVNGINTATLVNENWPSINPFTGVSVGWHPGDIKFEGSLDAVGIWNRALSDAEIAELYSAGAGIEYPFGGGSPTPSSVKIEGKAKFLGNVKFVS